MKTSTIILTTLISEVVAKNVANIQFSDDVIENLGNSGDDLENKGAKNVADLNFVVDDSLLGEKSAKNVFDASHLVIDEKSLEKRSPKNVAHLHLVIDKRSLKNVVNLDLLVDKEELSSRLAKRNIDFDITPNSVSQKEVEKDGEKFTEINFLCEEHPMVFDLSNDLLSKLGEEYNKLRVEFDTSRGKPLKYTLMPNAKSGTLATALDQEQNISIFASYIRDLVDLYQMCGSTDEFNINAADTSNNMLLVFAPSNSAMLALSKKPWQFPNTPSSDDEQVTKENIRHFVEAHLAKVSSKNFDADKTVKLSSLNGNTIYFRNGESGFQYKLERQQQWMNIDKIDILDNGALFTVSQALSSPERN